MRRMHAVVVSIVMLAVWSVAQTPTSSTYVVGTCKPTLPSYKTISAALAAVPAPVTVQVCPGTYPEQIVITQPVTLEGITNGNAGQVVVQTPAGGWTSYPNSLGTLVAPELFAGNVSGQVNISDITFDMTYAPASAIYSSGIFYQNSSGTVNYVTVRSGILTPTTFGVIAEGGSSNPVVTIQNSSFHDLTWYGIWAETSAFENSMLTANVKSNYIYNIPSGILLDVGSTSLVSSNQVTGTAVAIFASPGAAGSITSNTVFGSNIGVLTYADGVPVTSNKFVNPSEGILVASSVASIQSNTVVGAMGAGIDFNCSANPNVKSNFINDTGIALNNVPSSTATNNNYYNVSSIVSNGSCPKAR